MTGREKQQAWLGMFNVALSKTYNSVQGQFSDDPGRFSAMIEEAARVADAGLEEFRARVPKSARAAAEEAPQAFAPPSTPRRSLWERLFGRARKPALPVWVLHVEMGEEPSKDAKPEKLFRALIDGKPSAVGNLERAVTIAAVNRGLDKDVRLQASEDNGRTWTDVGDDGAPVAAPTVEKMFRVVCNGHTSISGCLAACRASLASIRAFDSNAAFQMSTDNGRTWVDVSDEGEPVSKADEPEKTFRVICNGHTSPAGSLWECRTMLASIMAFEPTATLQMSTDCGRTWVEVSDDGEPLPPPRPVEEPKCAFVREPEKAADPALSPPPPPADATENTTPKASA